MLAGQTGGGPSQEGPGSTLGLAGDAGPKKKGGKRGAVERPPPALEQPPEERGLQSPVPCAGE